MPHPDQKYIDALLTNDAPLLDELYQRFSGKIKTMVLHNHGNEGDARDVFQEALLIIYKRASSSEFLLHCPLEAFLYVVCKNRWLSELSRRNLNRVTFLDTERYRAEENYISLAEELQSEQQRLKLIQKKLATMGERCRELLLLSWQKKSLHEVADLLQITYGYARKKKSECMARLLTLVRADPAFENLKHEADEKQ